MKKPILILLLVMVLCTKIALGGFGSTYLPRNEETGTSELRLQLGEIGSIHIYPANPENNSIYFMITIREGAEYLVNTLEDSYEIPPNTVGDAYDIEMTFKLPRNATEGQKFRVSYKATSTTSNPREEGMVGIAPAGFVKRFDIVRIETVKKPIPKHYYYIGIGVVIGIVGTITLIVLLKKHKRKRRYYQW